MYVDLEIIKNNVILSYYDKFGDTKFKKFEISEMYEWETVDDSRDQNINKKYKNFDGQPVKRIQTNKFNKFGIVEFLRNIPKEDQEDIFSLSLPKIHFIDIETDITEESSPNIKEYVKQAINTVNTIALVSPEHVVDFFAIRPLTEDEQDKLNMEVNEYVAHLTETPYQINYHFFSDEKEMLEVFFKDYLKYCPLVTGWNVVDFDWQYIVNRAERIGADISLASPTRHVNRMTKTPLHIAILDYLEFYRKWDRKVKIKENYTLDSTAEAVLGVKKIKYDGTLSDLYNNDFKHYSFYNIIDTILVQLIHYRLKTINIPLTLAGITRISVYKSSSAVTITETLIFNELLKNNMVVSNENFNKERIKRLFVLNDKSFEAFEKAIKKQEFKVSLYKKLTEMRDEIYRSEEKFLKRIEEVINDQKMFDYYQKFILEKSETKYQGAFVKDPIVGLHEWVVSFDFASLYPTTMRQFNISMESFVDKIHRTIVNETRKGNTMVGKIICANGSIFKDKESILKVIITELYSRRKSEKKLMFEYITKSNKIKDVLKKLEETEN